MRIACNSCRSSEEHIFITLGPFDFELFPEKMALEIQMAFDRSAFVPGSNGRKLRFTRGRVHILGALAAAGVAILLAEERTKTKP